MKKGVIFVLCFFCCIAFPVFSQEAAGHEAIRDYMLERGYTEFNPQEEFAVNIFNRSCREVLGESFVSGAKRSNFFITLNDGLQYCFYFSEFQPGVPNIIVTMVAGPGMGFYKVNRAMEGETVMVTGEDGREETILLFY
ncbi:hypothetical protein K7I13_13075 [Brucepastera parasyntrophica]|uniref:hypothetical protein n=1 Tax=Brucepastera parasyntrophica TaxID=2880008 RepID=UPI0021094CB6|nr:hypothetical protein [Brucepastera parasyntrophica]ULQ59395.1 hypothetical protein K7I13_13075 [Brucepastera parasyntrophica]